MEKGDNDGSEDINGISSNTDQPSRHNFNDDFNYQLIYAAHGIDVWLRLELRKFSPSRQPFRWNPSTMTAASKRFHFYL